MSRRLRTAERLADPEYLRFQYADAERLRVRMDTHARYSENPVGFPDWLVRRIGVTPGLRLLDLGSGPGQYHERLAPMRVVALDLSPGILAGVRAPKVVGHAERLPFAGGVFDRVLCAHVLFHVPDIPRALREMRRVAAARARVVIATNSRNTMRPLFELQNEVARELGLGDEHSVAARFGLEDLNVVRAVFPAARADVYEDAFRFTAVEPVLAYVASMWVGAMPEPTRAAYLDGLARRIDAIIRRDGVFRVPKRSGCFVAEV